MNKFFENLKLRLGHICAEKQPLENKKKGFTLQETLITLTILGVVAAITIPALINKYIEATNRTKVRKAMAAYEKALGQMVVENGNTAISAWADGIANNCANTTVFFKKIQGEGCRFQTADKVWWDISDIEHPIISINGEIKDDMVAHPENYKDTEGLFYMVGTIDNNGILRINDLNTVPLSADDKAALEKLYAAVNGEKNLNNETPQQSAFMKTCNKDTDTSYTCNGKNFATITFDTTDTNLEDIYNDPLPSTIKSENGLAGMVTSGKTLAEAKEICENDYNSHLATAAELKQMSDSLSQWCPSYDCTFQNDDGYALAYNGSLVSATYYDSFMEMLTQDFSNTNLVVCVGN